jgi:hypothetical protein
MDIVKQRLMQELEKNPTTLLYEIFDFVQFLNQRHTQQSATPSSGWQPNFFEDVIGNF